MAYVLPFSEIDGLPHLCDFRIFIFGAEVTDYVTGSLSWTSADRDGFGTASFTLQNAADNFILTFENFGITPNNEKLASGPVFRNTKDAKKPIEHNMYSEAAKFSIYNKKLELSNGVKNSSGDKPWNLGVRNLIFHKNDPLRIFIRNPYLDSDEWYNVFTGYVDVARKQGSYINGESTISISCNDIRSLMSKMRISMQPTYGKQLATEFLNSPDSIFADVFLPSTNTHPLANTDFQTCMEILITGQGKLPSGGASAQLSALTNVFQTATGAGSTGAPKGIGGFTKGRVVEYDQNASDSAKANLLEDWYATLLLGSNGSKSKPTPLTYKEVSAIGAGTYPDGPNAPDKQQVHFLIPKGGTNAESLVRTEFAQGIEQIDWENRYFIIKNLCSVIDYQFWITGNGDIVFEFPMYDSTPDNFGKSYKKFLTVDNFIISDDISDEEGDIPTVMEVSGQGTYANTDHTTSLPPAIQPKVVVVSPALASRVGVNVETAQTLFTQIKSLEKIALIEYTKRLSESSKMSIEYAWRPFIFPNKPVFHKTEQRMGWVSAHSNTMQVHGQCSSNTTLRYIRRRNDKAEFSFITGKDSIAMSYVKAWKDQKGTDSGIKIIKSVEASEPGLALPQVSNPFAP